MQAASLTLFFRNLHDFFILWSAGSQWVRGSPTELLTECFTLKTRPLTQLHPIAYNRQGTIGVGVCSIVKRAGSLPPAPAMPPPTKDRLKGKRGPDCLYAMSVAALCRHKGGVAASRAGQSTREIYRLPTKPITGKLLYQEYISRFRFRFRFIQPYTGKLSRPA